MDFTLEGDLGDTPASSSLEESTAGGMADPVSIDELIKANEAAEAEALAKNKDQLGAVSSLYRNPSEWEGTGVENLSGHRQATAREITFGRPGGDVRSFDQTGKDRTIYGPGGSDIPIYDSRDGITGYKSPSGKTLEGGTNVNPDSGGWAAAGYGTVHNYKKEDYQNPKGNQTEQVYPRSQIAQSSPSGQPMGTPPKVKVQTKPATGPGPISSPINPSAYAYA